MFRQFLLPRHVLPQWLTVCKRHLDQTDKTDIHWGGGVLFLGGRFISFASIGWLFYAVVRLVVVQSYVPVLKKKKLDLYIAIVILITLS
ncbi:hypothetical protein SEEH1576_10827 [Salmonella enterica subsp. enterica serovar Heidelberg str. 41576]|nr:hypothetical protein SEEH1576_10827 [Salmonella enterica subsp. enterica serovar Heidelberg str. 41576]